MSDLENIRPFYRAQLLDALDDYLAIAPTRESKSCIKRLQFLETPAYRLRIGEFRIFYDVDERANLVVVLRILSKDASLAYLNDMEQQK